MKIVAFILIVLAAWMLPVTLYAVLTARGAEQPVIYVPVELQHPVKTWMVFNGG